jgi:membrane protein DedA with SNARE-associated domain
MFETLILRWGYLAIGIGTFFEGESIVIAGGALAHRGLLSLPWVMVAAAVGSVSGDQFWFYMGRRFGAPLLTRRAHWRERVKRAQQFIQRWGTIYVLSFRFIYGVRTISPLLLGASHYPRLRYAVLNLIGGVTWACCFSAAGWGVGAGIASAMHEKRHHIGLWAGVAMAAILVFWIGFRAWRGRRADRAALEVDSRDPDEPRANDAST